MQANNNKSPILNNPYDEPKYHYDATLEGNLDYTKVIEGRRPYMTNLNVLPDANATKGLFSASDMPLDEEANAPFINGIRAAVKEWREKEYPMTTRVTKDLLTFWFCNPEREMNKYLFFCQREAIETAVWLNEVAPRDPNLGRSFLHDLQERRETISSSYADVLPRTAFKMATGTGKTVVMAMLILYHFLNKKEYHGDTRFADHFLLVAPGITIRDRLGVLYIDESNSNKYDKIDYYHQRGLIPQKYEALLGGLNAVITITNYHQFEPKVYTGKKSSPLDGKLVYNNGEMVKQNDKEDFNSVLSRVIGKNMKGRRIVVINDEAHHCYLPKTAEGKKKRDEEEAETEEENKKAMVWYEGLRQMKALGYKLQEVYDLSATPYYLKGSGYPEYSLFPWVVSDFGLVDAIESGLVKIPFLPSMDTSHDLDEPKLRNIYKHISKDLPKKGQKKAKKEARAEAEKKGNKDVVAPEAAPILPSLLNLALEQFVEDYEKYDKGTREEGEASVNLFTAPPVFIVVCNNTTVSKEVYKYIAGYESVDADGNPIFIDGHFPIFSNFINGLPKTKQPSLLIDSAAIDEAGNKINDEFRSVFAEEIQIFKKEYAQLHGAGSADNLSDGDILREVVNSVGRPGKLGHHIRCVVSVSMLTEGWDANTVTHICGVRAFGSQLLCEQVAGRALRRQSYELTPYDKNGDEINLKDVRRYKPENITWKFPPEYAHIIGVPFKTFKGGEGGTPPPSKPKTIIKALKEREAMEIVFPNIVGYRSENPMGRIEADYSAVPKFRLNFNEIPDKTTMATALGDDVIVLKNDFREMRDAQVIYVLTQWLIREKFTSHDNGREFQKFGQLKKVVEKWYNEQVEILGGDGSPELRRLVAFWKQDNVANSIYEGIRQANSEEEKITAILNYYNPKGSSKYVFGATSKPTYPTEKSHVNCVVADTDSWEQIAAKTLEEMDEVKYYVKNHFLDFKIPYLDGDVERNYVTDFIAVVKAPDGRDANLIIEISGFSNDKTGNKDIKRLYTTKFWIPAANNLKEYGEWAFVEITDIDNIKALLKQRISEL